MSKRFAILRITSFVASVLNTASSKLFTNSKFKFVIICGKKMAEEKVVELSEAESELYDRQIRLWGLESQKRIRSATVLIAGLNGFGAEVAKNIVLSGVKGVTFLDHQLVTENDFCSQFFVPREKLGQNRAEASLVRAQTLNPMVKIVIDKDNVNDKPDAFFKEFNVVILIESSTDTLIRVNNACRQNGVKFFAGDVWGMHGYTFADLQEHEYAEDVVKHKLVNQADKKTKQEKITTTVKRTIKFPPLEEVLAFDHTAPYFMKKIKRSGPSYLIMKCLQFFRDTQNRDPLAQSREEDFKKLLSIRNELADGLIPDSAFLHVFAQVSPVAAIVGGQLSQEVIKAVSQKEAPNVNLFLFDPEKCCGFIEPIAVY